MHNMLRWKLIINPTLFSVATSMQPACPTVPVQVTVKFTKLSQVQEEDVAMTSIGINQSSASEIASNIKVHVQFLATGSSFIPAT